ncbi:MAG TPA: single-stranded-DNA-specific exonuclease RecJ [Thermomicrobiales bacterium]|nr:single-stranded-DNA-specific exonuclease RecJ [Thermomicrobiales bacterium]
MIDAGRAVTVEPSREGSEHAALWRVPPPIPAGARFTESALLDSILFRRGVRSNADAHDFLNPRETPLGDPFLLPDMRSAVDLIRTAIGQQQRIVVFGDYDVDGLTSTAMLVRVLRRLGADPIPIIPHRVRDGYGVNSESLQRIVETRPQLVITVDCGSSSQLEFEHLVEMGAQAIVLDHHQYSGSLPASVAFVSARRPDNAYPFADLAAVGVAYALARALLGDDGASMYLPYVALGSVADVVGLTGENRALVARGLSKLRRWTLPGLIALCDTAGVDQRTLNTWDIGYLLGPRLNAAGRVDTPRLALDLLLAEDIAAATPLASRLSELNAVRQGETRRTLDAAEAQLAELGGATANAAIVLSGEGWNVGVVGLVAARVAERHCRPTVVLEDAGAVSSGSARTAGGVDIVKALATCSDLLQRFGGHSAAAGLSIASVDVPELRRRLSGAVLEALGGQMPRREHDIDAIASHADLSLNTVDLLDRLEPCGEGNARPALLVPALRQRYVKTSRDGAHLMFQVIDDAGYRHRAVMFGAGSRMLELLACPSVDILTRLDRDTWQGRTRLNLRVVDFRAAEPGNSP